ncbi:MAG: heterodisulfide reductase-related iron-sulfur binding cluster [Anaerolineales bacterium]
MAMVNILRRLGIDVDFARDQTCCGQPPSAQACTLARVCSRNTSSK